MITWSKQAPSSRGIPRWGLDRGWLREEIKWNNLERGAGMSCHVMMDSPREGTSWGINHLYNKFGGLQKTQTWNHNLNKLLQVHCHSFSFSYSSFNWEYIKLIFPSQVLPMRIVSDLLILIWSCNLFHCILSPCLEEEEEEWEWVGTCQPAKVHLP